MRTVDGSDIPAEVLARRGLTKKQLQQLEQVNTAYSLIRWPIERECVWTVKPSPWGMPKGGGDVSSKLFCLHRKTPTRVQNPCGYMVTSSHKGVCHLKCNSKGMPLENATPVKVRFHGSGIVQSAALAAMLQRCIACDFPAIFDAAVLSKCPRNWQTRSSAEGRLAL